MRIHTRKYFNLFSKKIKYFFIELKNNIENDIIELDDYIYIKGDESLIPGIYIKSIINLILTNCN